MSEEHWLLCRTTILEDRTGGSPSLPVVSCDASPHSRYSFQLFDRTRCMMAPRRPYLSFIYFPHSSEGLWLVRSGPSLVVHQRLGECVLVAKTARPSPFWWACRHHVCCPEAPAVGLDATLPVPSGKRNLWCLVHQTHFSVPTKDLLQSRPRIALQTVGSGEVWW